MKTEALARDLKDFGLFRGLAVPWSAAEDGAMFVRGAFRRSLDRWRRSGNPLPLLDSHQARSVRNVIGKVVDAEETDAGLEIIAQLVPTPDGDRIRERLELGAVTGLSVGVKVLRERRPRQYERDAGAERVIEEAALREVSLVVFPAHSDARVLALDEDPPKTWTPADRLVLRARVHLMRTRAMAYDIAPDKDLPRTWTPEDVLRLHIRVQAMRTRAMAYSL